jgi:hypothetical protein
MQTVTVQIDYISEAINKAISAHEDSLLALEASLVKRYKEERDRGSVEAARYVETFFELPEHAVESVEAWPERKVGSEALPNSYIVRVGRWLIDVDASQNFKGPRVLRFAKKNDGEYVFSRSFTKTEQMLEIIAKKEYGTDAYFV